MWPALVDVASSTPLQTLLQIAFSKAAISPDVSTAGHYLEEAMQRMRGCGLQLGTLLYPSGSRDAAEFMTPLHSAAREGIEPEVTTFLIQRLLAGGAHLEASCPPANLHAAYTPLLSAMQNPNAAAAVAAVQALLLAGTRPGSTLPDGSGAHALHYAVCSHTELVQLLLTWPGVDVNAPGPDLMTPLHVVVNYARSPIALPGVADTVGLLLDAGADPRVRVGPLPTPLKHAADGAAANPGLGTSPSLPAQIHNLLLQRAAELDAADAAAKVTGQREVMHGSAALDSFLQEPLLPHNPA